MIDALGVHDLWRQRRNDATMLLNQMRKIKAAYNGEIIVPLPELDKSDKAQVANLICQGIDQLSGRISSTMPVTDFPSVKPGDRGADRRSKTRKNAHQGWHEANKYNLKIKHRSRYLTGYASSPISIRPGKKFPIFEVLNPLFTFPSFMSQVDQMVPEDCIVESQRSRAWLWAKGYGEELQKLKDFDRTGMKPDDQFTILTYGDKDVVMQVVIPPEQIGKWGGVTYAYGERARVIDFYENKCGHTPFVVPQRITLDRPQGQFDQMLGMYSLQAKLMALEVIAVERGIFPDQYLVSRAGEQARFIAGPFDGRTGEVNIVAGGDIKDMPLNPGYQTNQAMDRLERGQRLNGGLPSEFGGESGSNIRTGRRGDSVLSAVIDMPIMEAQELLGASQEYENEIAADIEKYYYGTATRSVYIPDYTTGSKKSKVVTYTPNQIFGESTTNRVTYPAVGTDANGLVIALGQRVGMGIMSKKTAGEMDPWIDDAEKEHDRTTAEALENALLQGLQAKAMSGELPPTDLARIMQLVKDDTMELAGAVSKVQEEAQARQAAQAPQGAPATMPGIAQPGMGAEQPVQPSIGEPPASAQNLSQLFTSLRTPAMQLPAEQGAVL